VYGAGWATRAGRNYAEKPNVFNFQNLNPVISARRINLLLSLIIIVITNFGLTGLDLKALTINNESYVIYEAKALVLNDQKTLLI